MVQVYRETPASYARGRRVNMEEWNTITRTLETDVQLKFGVPVQRGTGNHGCVPFTSGDLLGITEANLVLPHPGDYYTQYDNVAIMESGVIGVLVSGTVQPGDPAAYNAGNDTWGVADTTTETIIGEFDAGGTDEVVPLRLRKPTTTVLL